MRTARMQSMSMRLEVVRSSQEMMRKLRMNRMSKRSMNELLDKNKMKV